jgi:hypothetical protein
MEILIPWLYLHNKAEEEKKEKKQKKNNEKDDVDYWDI